MNIEKPLVSIIMNCHNGEEFLKQAIDSIYYQTYSNWEIIFIDNLSNDNSALIAKKFDSKLNYFTTYNYMPLYEARNFAINKCQGELITFLDCDDIWHNDKLYKQVNAFQSGHSVSFGDYLLIDKNSKEINSFKTENKQEITTNLLLKKNMISIGTIMIEKNLLKENNFDPNYELLGDFDLWIRLSLKTKFYKCNGFLESSRVHQKNHSKLLKERWLYERRYFYQNFLKKKNFWKFTAIFRYIVNTELKGILRML